MASYLGWRAVSAPEMFGEPEEEVYDEDDWCRRCGIKLPAERSEDRRMIGWPDQFHDIEVRLYRQCACGHQEFDEGGYYE